MLGLFLFILVLSVVIAGVCHFAFPDRFNVFESILIIVGSLIVGGVILLFCSWNSSSDYDILNGQVTGKEMERVSCSHSYSCHCRTTTTKNGSTTHCDTCYEHFFDQDWEVHSTAGTIDIDRRDRQGLVEPPRWTIVQKTDPVSRTEHVANYVLAAPDSLFNQKNFPNDLATYGKWFPAYPRVYDYYKFDHVINAGVAELDTAKYNTDTALMLRDVGPSKQANIVIVFVPTADRAYLNALERHWLGSKKNDIVVAIGVTHYPKVDWAGAFTFGKSVKNELLVVKMRNTIETVGDVSKVDDIIGQVRVNAQYYFNRQPMSNYEYLKHDYFPSGKALIWSGIIYLIMLIGLLIFFWMNDITTDGVATNNRFRYNSRY